MQIFPTKAKNTWNKKIALLCILSCSISVSRIAGGVGLLGAPGDIAKILSSSGRMCHGVVGSMAPGADVSGIDLMTGSMHLAQLQFAQNFLKFDANEEAGGLFQALNVTFPGVGRMLEEGADIAPDKVNPKSPSYLMRRHGHRETDRTLTSIRLLQKIIAGEPLSSFEVPPFVSKIGPNEDTLREIRQFTMGFLTGDPRVNLEDPELLSKVQIDRLNAMLVRLVYHDQGKFEKVIHELETRHAEAGQTGPLSADHDVVVKDMTDTKPGGFASVMAPENLAVSPSTRGFVENSQIGAVNPGRFFQYEAPAHHILELAKFAEESGELGAETFDFWMLKELLDVGGAQGSAFPDGSFFITPVVSNYFKLRRDFMDGKLSSPERIAGYYDDSLRQAGAKIQKYVDAEGNPLPMPTETPSDLAKVKLASLMRLNHAAPKLESQDGRPAVYPQARRVSSIDVALDQLKTEAPDDHDLLLKALERKGVGDGRAYTFGYFPDISDNVRRHPTHDTYNKQDIEGGASAYDQELAVSDEKIVQSTLDTLRIYAKMLRAGEEKFHILENESSGSGEVTLEGQPVALAMKGDKDSPGYSPYQILNGAIEFEVKAGDTADAVVRPGPPPIPAP